MLFTLPVCDVSHPLPYPCFSLQFSVLLHSPSWIMPCNNNLEVNQLICCSHLTRSSRLRVVPPPCGCRSRSRAGCPLGRRIPGRSRSPAQRPAPPPLPSRSAPGRPQLSALTSVLARAGVSEPAAAAALLKKPERAAPLSFYVRAREQPPPPGSGRCSRAPGAPAFSVWSLSLLQVCSASLPRLSSSACGPQLSWGSPVPVQPLAEGKGCAVGWKSNRSGSSSCSLSPALHRRWGRSGRIESKSTLGAHVVRCWLRAQASCFMCLAAADPPTPEQ